MDNTRKTVFLVDDVMTNLRVGKAALSDIYNVFTINSAASMFEMLESIKPDMILLDVNMPEMDGYEAIEILKANKFTAQIPVIFLTGLDDEKMELKGLSMGAVDYITKPFSPPLLLKRLEVHLLVESQKQQLVVFNNNLSQMVEEKTETIIELKDAIVATMAELVEFRDEVTGYHIVRVRRYLKVLMDAMRQNGVYADELEKFDEKLVLQSSQLHDVGKIGVSDTILNKPGKLDPEEFEKIKTHTTFGETVIQRLKDRTSDSDFLEYARIFAVAHHEKWNGSGYPHGLKGEEIPLLGRMMAIADVYDALCESRPYKAAFSHEKAVSIIMESSGSHFDPSLAELFNSINEEFEKIAAENMD